MTLPRQTGAQRKQFSTQASCTLPLAPSRVPERRRLAASPQHEETRRAPSFSRFSLSRSAPDALTGPVHGGETDMWSMLAVPQKSRPGSPGWGPFNPCAVWDTTGSAQALQSPARGARAPRSHCRQSRRDHQPMESEGLGEVHSTAHGSGDRSRRPGVPGCGRRRTLGCRVRCTCFGAAVACDKQPGSCESQARVESRQQGGSRGSFFCTTRGPRLAPRGRSGVACGRLLAVERSLYRHADPGRERIQHL